MPEGKPIPVRLSEELIVRLDKTAEALGTKRAALIRLCLTGFLDYYEANGGQILMPANWKELMQQLDGRTARHSDPEKNEAKRSKIKKLK